ncbi:Protein of unknown function [Pyronema omphalodes CBS 100304]|uniref:Uncharacterized protein n=1 Tax=Pyronema omphalodes (strain CBS 100304) TaxID=1076935 RepID=U4LU20_PYROM|nr:Protein of unknown function [Pyronema omphalodes CBS 100304]
MPALQSRPWNIQSPSPKDSDQSSSKLTYFRELSTSSGGSQQWWARQLPRHGKAPTSPPQSSPQGPKGYKGNGASVRVARNPESIRDAVPASILRVRHRL